MTSPLDQIKPLMSVQILSAVPFYDEHRRDLLKVKVNYGVPVKFFEAIVSKAEWRQFINSKNDCEKLFWEM